MILDLEANEYSGTAPDIGIYEFTEYTGQSGDLNQDNEVNIVDVVYLVQIILELIQINPNQYILGDLSQDGVGFARENYNLDIFCGSVFEIGFPSHYFDVITLYHVLEHIPEPNLLLKELQRILNILLEPFRHSDRQEALACLAARGGLRLLAPTALGGRLRRRLRAVRAIRAARMLAPPGTARTPSR